MNDKDLKHELFICECNNVEHQLIFSYLKDEDEVYMEVHLIPESNILKRIWDALKYIFGYRSKYGHFDEFIFHRDDASKLAKIVKYLDPNVFIFKTEESDNS